MDHDPGRTLAYLVYKPTEIISFKEPDFLLFRERRLIRSAVGSRRKRFYGLAVEKIFLLTADAANAFEEFHRECKAAALRIVSERVKERDVGKDISGLQKRQRFR